VHFDTFERTGKAEFPFPKQVVFRALCEAVAQKSKMKIESRDALASRLEIMTGMSALSWGERITVRSPEAVSTGHSYRLNLLQRRGWECRVAETVRTCAK
jgi:hypothetical protein